MVQPKDLQLRHVRSSQGDTQLQLRFKTIQMLHKTDICLRITFWPNILRKPGGNSWIKLPVHLYLYSNFRSSYSFYFTIDSVRKCHCVLDEGHCASCISQWMLDYIQISQQRLTYMHTLLI